MNFSRPSLCLTVLVVLCASTAAFAKVPVRGSSSNGEDTNAIHWNLLSVSAPLTLAANGKRAIATRQTICIGQDVENSLDTPDPALTGTCHSGVYMHVFQLQSTATDVTITLGQITDFVADENFGNFGVLTCDPDNNNTLELCTNDPDDPTGANIPDITFSVSRNKKIASFAIPSFPSFPAGIHNQGQGLTIFLITRQPAALPIQIPKISIR